MSEERKKYTTAQIAEIVNNLKLPEDPESANEVEVTAELNVKMTVCLYRNIDKERPNAPVHVTLHFYNEEGNEGEDDDFNYLANLMDVSGDKEIPVTNIDDVAFLFRIKPEDVVWEVEQAPDPE